MTAARLIAATALGPTFSGRSITLINPRKEPRRAAAVGVVFVTELGVQQPLFRADARDERRDQQRRQQHADSPPKRQRPSPPGDEPAQKTGGAKDAIEPAPDPPMAQLGGDKAPGT